MQPRRHLREYRNLLNECIRDAASGEPFTCSTSQIGASIWTAAEKDAFFRQLPLVGSNNLPALALATAKSEFELQSYLTALRSHAEAISPADIPAAAEISDIEPGLDDSADALAGLVFEHEIREAKAEFDQTHPWLIDQDVVDAIRERLAAEEAEKGPEIEGEDTKPEEVGDAVAMNIEPTDAMTLLRAEAFIDLSRSLFMNSATDPDQNWSTCPLISDAVSEPSIFRSAFEDFYNLIVCRTRRIIQAAIFQAMTRLRASDSSRPDWEPVEAVREVDVHAALDLLNMPYRADKFWVHAASRCHVKVYSDSKKYADGRVGTKIGRELTSDEVEWELGGPHAGAQDLSLQDVDISEDEIEEFMDDWDNFTENSDPEETEALGVEGDTSQSRSRSHSRSRKRKRKRALSPDRFLHAENRYLETLDRNASIGESSRLADLLIFDAEEGSLRKKQKLRDLPGSPGPPPDNEKTISDFTSRLEYEAEWESPYGPVDLPEFEDMGQQGVRGRKRRRLLMLKVQDRLVAENCLCSDEEDEADEGAEEPSDDTTKSDSEPEEDLLDSSQEDGTSSSDKAEHGESVEPDAAAGARQDSDDEEESDSSDI